MPRPRGATFFLSGTVDKVLREITTAMGIRTQAVHPRAHDLRHRFAVATLIAWHKAGVDADEHIGVLSAYLGCTTPPAQRGHGSARSTFSTRSASAACRRPCGGTCSARAGTW